ncbi:hypothetical protein PHLGIDRAFT_130864 [Phlebiopsis gigantea 11061_1 CR5-6]|uniref:Uncharacterized protein n=1 Tax=Phlebiopsis gigantea (strain 11061_1 CR5-6) TaxID=745531 RepID=A0A0C3S327_PHLG1|nr:hypothetical protein PHLGIDRAFT_130864 [Phlebiopsis gigantea 11061_1 CR5-6]
MNAVASSSFYVSSEHKAGYEYTPWAQNTVSYDHRGRLQPFVETEEQRRARSEFMRKREFSRRINAWIQDSTSSNTSKSDTDSLRTIDEDEEDEPEVIYATSPSLAAARNNHWAGASSPPTPTRPLSRHLRASSRTSSRSSLSSISEESV